MAMALFFLMVAVYVAAGLSARRYGPRLRLLLLGVSVLVPTGILLGWVAA